MKIITTTQDGISINPFKAGVAAGIGYIVFKTLKTGVDAAITAGAAWAAKKKIEKELKKAADNEESTEE